MKTHLGRFGLLFTTVAMATVLVISGLLGYHGATRSAASLTRALALDMMVAVRRALQGTPTPDKAALEELLGEWSDKGLSFVAVLGPPPGTWDPARHGPAGGGGFPGGPGEGWGQKGPRPPGPPAWSWPGGRGAMHLPTPLAEAGTPAPASAWRNASFPQGLHPHMEIMQSADGRLVRVVAPLPMRPGRGMGPGRGGPGAQGPWPPGPGLAIECAPPLPKTIVQRALVTLAIDVGAAILLLAVAVFFWRLSRQAERAAAELERERRLAALGEMSAVLGHEIRNPLASLKGNAQLLLEKLEEGTPARTRAERVVREAIRLEELTDHILEFVRTGGVSPAPCDPVAVARAAVETVAAASVRLEADGAPAEWAMDADRMESVLTNLLKNAAAASPPGSEIELVVAAEGEQLVYEVRDRGTGIPAGDEHRIFEPFFTTRAKGTGLGLALARRIVEAHGGTIVASNRPEGGTAVRVALPRGPSARTRDREREARERGGIEGGTNPGRR